jgi:hypothetical protein
MPQDSQKIIRQLSDHIVTPDFEDYLLSEQFTRFCREHDIEDIWEEELDMSREKPYLYGGDTIHEAFFWTLQHLYQKKKDEFPRILAGFLADFSGSYPVPSFFYEISEDLIRLGYSKKEVEDKFSKIGK